MKDLIQKCIFCGEKFKTEDKKSTYSSRHHYGGDYKVLEFKVAQIDIYLLKFDPDLELIKEEIDNIYDLRKEDLKKKLSQIKLEEYLIQAAMDAGLKREEETYKKTIESLIEELIPKPSGSIRCPSDFSYVECCEYSPKEYKCHKSCWPGKDSMTINELMQTHFGELLSQKFENIDPIYKSIMPKLMQQKVKIRFKDYDPFNPYFKED